MEILFQFNVNLGNSPIKTLRSCKDSLTICQILLLYIYNIHFGDVIFVFVPVCLVNAIHDDITDKPSASSVKTSKDGFNLMKYSIMHGFTFKPSLVTRKNVNFSFIWDTEKSFNAVNAKPVVLKVYVAFEFRAELLNRVMES